MQRNALEASLANQLIDLAHQQSLVSRSSLLITPEPIRDDVAQRGPSKGRHGRRRGLERHERRSLWRPIRLGLIFCYRRRATLRLRTPHRRCRRACGLDECQYLDEDMYTEEGFGKSLPPWYNNARAAPCTRTVHVDVAIARRVAAPCLVAVSVSCRHTWSNGEPAVVVHPRGGCSP